MAFSAARALPANRWINVDSTCLSRVRVEDVTPSAVTLVIEFADSGYRYRARGVAHEDVGDLLTAASVGTFWNRSMRDSYVWRRV